MINLSAVPLKNQYVIPLSNKSIDSEMTNDFRSSPLNPQYTTRAQPVSGHRCVDVQYADIFTVSITPG